MYRPVAPAVGMFPRQRMFSFLIPIVFGTSLFVIAAVIVLALLPIYLETKTLTPNTNAVRSQPVTMSVEVQASNTSSKSRNRRATDLSAFTPGDITTAGMAMIASQLKAQIPSKKVQDLSFISASLAYGTSKRRKRLTISKRATPKILLILKFYLIFISGCYSTCQTATGTTLSTALQGLSPAAFSFSNLPITVNGVLTSIPLLQFISIQYVSAILPGTSSVTPAVPVLIANLTTTATTTAVITSTAATTPMILG